MTVERNIHLLSGKYRVLITRRPKNIYGGRFDNLSDARAKRDSLEASIAPQKPWGLTKKKAQRRTIQVLRTERIKAGLCMSCGDEPPKIGCKSCQACMDILNTKRKERRLEAKRLKSK